MRFATEQTFSRSCFKAELVCSLVPSAFFHTVPITERHSFNARDLHKGCVNKSANCRHAFCHRANFHLLCFKAELVCSLVPSAFFHTVPITERRSCKYVFPAKAGIQKTCIELQRSDSPARRIVVSFNEED